MQNNFFNLPLSRRPDSATAADRSIIWLKHGLCHNLTRVLPVETTRLSTKGQIILPKNIRASRAWRPGTEFTIEETDDGILLRPAARFPETELGNVAGCLRSKRKPKAATQTRIAIEREVMRRHDRGRY